MKAVAQSSTDDRSGAISKIALWNRLSFRQLRIVASWLAIAAYLSGFAISAALRSQSDFTIYRNAGLAAAAGRPIYDFRDWSPFQYAPIYAILFIPFGLISRRPAQLLWFAVSMAAALPAMIIGTYRMLLGPEFELSAEMIIVPLVLILRFLHPNFDHGQINLVVVAMIVWGLALTYESKPVSAGFLLAASLLVKPLALPVLAYLLFRKRFAIIISVIAFSLALLCLPSLFLGLRPAIDQTIDYFTTILARVPLSRLSHHLLSTNDQSASAIAVRLLSPTKGGLRLTSQARAAALGFTLDIALLGLVIWRSADHRNPARDRLELAAVFCFIPSFLPLSWLEYYVVLIVPYAALVTELSEGKSDGNRAKIIYGVLASTFVLNVGSRFVGAWLYCGAPYFCSLAILSTLLGSRKLACSTAFTKQVDVAWDS